MGDLALTGQRGGAQRDVDKRVGNVKNNDGSLLEPVSP